MKAEVTEFERDYTSKVNQAGLALLALHLPVLAGIAAVTHAGAWMTAGIALLLLAGPAVVILGDRASQLGAIAIAVAAMGISGLAIHVAGGMIEAHFELFVLIAMLTVFGRVAPLLVAGGTIALHHVIFWLWLPASVFNYRASFWIVLLHAGVVVLEVIPCCYIARQLGRSIRAQGIVMEHLGGAAEQVGLSSGEIGEASSRLAQAASEQAATIEETSASSVELSQISVQAAKAIENTLGLMVEMEQQLTRANQDLTMMQEVIGEMVTSSKQISNVVKVIDGIAFQTNILSLNAAVEAATAGSFGAGFAVVAAEVGSLAQKSATAATNTADLIEATLHSTKTGESAAEKLGSAMSRVTGTAALVRTQINLLRDGSRSQEKASAHIKQALLDLGNAAQETAAGAEESAAAGTCMKDQAATLREIVLMLQE